MKGERARKKCQQSKSPLSEDGRLFGGAKWTRFDLSWPNPVKRSPSSWMSYVKSPLKTIPGAIGRPVESINNSNPYALTEPHSTPVYRGATRADASWPVRITSIEIGFLEGQGGVLTRKRFGGKGRVRYSAPGSGGRYQEMPKGLGVTVGNGQGGPWLREEEYACERTVAHVAYI